MSGDHRKLRVFHDAHALTLAIYKHTRNFPKDEWFGIRAQLRRAAVSIPSNLVEGNARSTTRDYLKFLYIALGSASELNYLAGLSEELGYWGRTSSDIQQRCKVVVKQLERLTQTMEAEAAAQKEKQTGPQTGDRRPETGDRRPETEDYEIAFVAAMNVARGSKPIDV